MKKILFLIGIGICLGISTRAQCLRIQNNTCTDLLVELAAVCPDNCATASLSVTVPANTTTTLCSPAVSINWNFGIAPSCNNWQWWGATYSQVCLISTGSGSGCPYDISNVGGTVAPCGTLYGGTSCMELSGSCGSCPAGTIINATFTSTFSAAPPMGYLGSTITFN